MKSFFTFSITFACLTIPLVSLTVPSASVISTDGSCSSADLATINEIATNGPSGKNARKCLASLHEQIHQNSPGPAAVSNSSFGHCLQQQGVLFVPSCVSCFEKGATIVFANCNYVCGSDWCSKRCLACRAPAFEILSQCTRLESSRLTGCTKGGEIGSPEGGISFLNPPTLGRPRSLFPLSKTDYELMVLMTLGLIVAAGGGIGGGGILVPLLMLVRHFQPKYAIAISNVTIFGGSIANSLLNTRKVLPDGRSVIDWDIVLIMEPTTIFGAVIGSVLAKYLPNFVLLCMLIIFLALMSVRVLGSGIKMFLKENSTSLSDTTFKQNPQEDSGISCAGLATGKVDEISLPWRKISLLVLCFAGSNMFTILKGGGDGSVIGVKCGSTAYWLLTFGSLPWVFGCTVFFAKMVLDETSKREVSNGPARDIVWNMYAVTVYPILCSISGLIAGLFGIGGGIVKGPLMLELGVQPIVASATAAAMIFFTSGSACVSYMFFDLLPYDYALVYSVLGFAATAFGQVAMSHIMGSRQSPLVISIGSVLAISSLLVLVRIYRMYQLHTFAELFRPGSLCH